jgi:hypothetical protein
LMIRAAAALGESLTYPRIGTLRPGLYGLCIQ